MANDNDMALVTSCANILLSPACQSIAFPWLGQNISGKGYREVTHALLESRIKVRVKPMSDAAGKYSYLKDRLTLGSPFNPRDLDDQMTVVHESTHAIQDIECDGAWLARWDMEAAAFVAEWCYFLNSNPTNKQWDDRSTDTVNALAMEIAGKIDFNLGPVDSNLMNKLTDAILADPDYHDQMFDDPLVQEDGVDPPEFP
jgi:hypothetical protein